MRNISMILFTLLFIFLAFVSCSGKPNPLNPSFPDRISPEISSEINTTDAKKENDNRGVFGAWRIRIDTNTMSYEIIPARNAQAIGNIFDADLSQFLEVTPCANCLTIPRVYPDGYENLNMVVRMKHPFGNIATRPDLHGFDVRGIFILPSDTDNAGIKVMRPSGVEEDASYSTQLLNADGYTSHFDELASDSRYFIGGTVVSGNLNPFLRFFEDYSTPHFDPHAPAGQNVMPVGSGNYDRTAVLKKLDTGSVYDFYIVADVAYGQSAKLANRANPQYYLPAFHRTEAWRVEYWIENNILSHGDETSTADVMIQAFDWQQGATVDPDYPNPTNLSGIPEKSDVLQVELSIPDLQNDLLIVTTPEAGSGTPSDPLRYRITVTNVNQCEGPYVYGLLAIRDDLYGAASPSGRMPIPSSPAGFPYPTLDILDYALYATIRVNIENPYISSNYTNTVLSNWELSVPNVDQVAHESPISGYRTTIHPNFFIDPSNKKFQYRWDYDYDGVTFDIDGSGMPSPEIEYAAPGKKNVGLRVRTNSVPPKEYIYQFPVYAEGLAYQNTIPSTGTNRESTSESRCHSIACTDTHTYLVYTSEIGSHRDIWLAIIDRSGNMTTQQITDDLKPDYQPCVLLPWTGSEYLGVYIAWASYEAPNMFVYATYGNLDGTGFEASHIKRITLPADSFELNPIFFFSYPQLQIYYVKYNGMESYIYRSHSEDHGETWIEDGWVVDNGSTSQSSPSITHSGIWDVLVWEDGINFTTRGTDLYMGICWSGYTFNQIKNISHFIDKTSEESPMSTYGPGGNQVVAYLMVPDGSTTKTAHVKLANVFYGSIADFPMEEGTDGQYTHTMPSVLSPSDGSYFVSYGSYNKSTQELTAYVIQLTEGSGFGDWDNTLYLEQLIGTVTSDYGGYEIYPAIAVNYRLSYAKELFIAYRSFSDGVYESAVNPLMKFGRIQMMYIVNEKIDY